MVLNKVIFTTSFKMENQKMFERHICQKKVFALNLV